MKKILIFSTILMSNIITTSIFGMLTQYALRVNPKNYVRRYSQLEPGTKLKSPKEVLTEIDKYWEKYDKTDLFLLKTNNPDEYNKRMRQGRELLEDALVASHMISQVMIENDRKQEGTSYLQNIKNFLFPQKSALIIKPSKQENRLGNWHRFSYAWFGSDDNHQDYIYATSIEANRIEANKTDVMNDMDRWINDKKIKNYQVKLNEAILNLRTNYTYDKERENRRKE